MTAQANPLIHFEGLPPFDRIEDAHMVPAIRALLAEAAAAIEAIEASVAPTYASAVTAVEEAVRPLYNAWGVVTHLSSVRDSEALRAAQREVQGDVVAFSLRVGQSRPIYEALRALRDADGWATLSGAQQRVVEQQLLHGQLAGVGLDGDARDTFNALSQESAELGMKFSNHLQDDTKAFALDLRDATDVAGLPATALRMYASAYADAHEGSGDADPESGPWRVTLDGPSYVAFMQHAAHRGHREHVYRAFIRRGSSEANNNEPVFERLLSIRKQMAGLLNYPCYAEVSLATKMASLDGVRALSGRLLEAAMPAARRELAEIEAFAHANGHEGAVERWDLAFWSERLREERFCYTDEELRPYFPLPKVLAGLFGIVERLFDARVVAANGETPVWHPDVQFFRIEAADGSPLAAFYLDPYSRPATKRGGAWMNDCVTRRRTENSVVIPVAYLTCNGTPPVGDRPSLMTFGEVETLYHEFGHGLQHMLTTVDEPSAAGINGVEWDAVELASQFMENWCYQRDVVRGMTAHVETGEPLPDDLFDKIVASRTFCAGLGMARQIYLGTVDMELHSTYDPHAPGARAMDVAHRIARETQVQPLLDEDRSLCSFAHIFAGGYSAGYYSYKWAEVLSADAFGAFEEAGLDNDDAIREVGHRFRDTVLALGGAEHPVVVYRAFRGRDAEPDALLRHHGLVASASA